MHSDILDSYLNRDVEISTTSRKSFTGNLKLHDTQREIVVLTPKHDDYTSKHYGEVVIKQHDIVSIREIYPCIEEDEEAKCDTEESATDWLCLV